MGVLGDIWQPLILTLQLASLTTLLLLPIATPIAWWVVNSRSRWRETVGAIVTLPLVLPPTVLGFYLLIALGPYGPGGLIAGLWGARSLAFSFHGLVIGSVIYSLPFMVQPIRVSFESIGDEPIEAAATLGASGWQTFLRVVIPQARNGFLTGAILTFAHTVGEFGVVLMIGGNIPGTTKVLSVAIFDFIERGLWADAHVVALGMVIFAFAVLTATSMLARQNR